MVSIIIPTCNRPKTLLKVIDSYLCQEHIRELIIVNDGSTLSYDEVISVIRDKAARKNIDVIYLKNEVKMGAGAARNIGLAKARAEYILWGEDDLQLRYDYVKTLLKKQPQKQICFGTIICDCLTSCSKGFDVDLQKRKEEQNNHKIPLFNYKTLEGYYRFHGIEDRYVPYGHAIILVKRSFYGRQISCEDYEVNGYREETDAQVKMGMVGIPILYTTDTECYHLKKELVEKYGGQHSVGVLRHTYYRIKNNNRFINRYYNYFVKWAKEDGERIMSKQGLKLYYIGHMASDLAMIAYKKIRQGRKKECRE